MSPVHSKIPLLTLPVELLQFIAVILATSSPTGPPNAIIPFLSTCRSLYHVIHQPQVYASIFCIQFDTAALQRRFSPGLITALGLTTELQRRWNCLRRIRAAATAGEDLWRHWKRSVYSPAMVKEDLMVAYLMFLESDGRNAMHLIQWAQLPVYLSRYGKHVVLENYDEPVLPSDSEENALFAWLHWFCLDFHRSITERRTIPFFLTSFVLGTFAYEGFLAPWPYHHLPLPQSSSLLSLPSSFHPQTQHGPLEPEDPAFFTVNNTLTPRPTSTALNLYFGHALEVAVPLVSQAATLAYFATSSHRPFFGVEDWLPFRPDYTVPTIPPTGFTSASTVLSGSPIVFAQPSFTPPYMQTRFASITDSRVYDDEWKRATSCCDPTRPTRTKELGMPRYRFTRGSLTRDWDARLIAMTFDTYHHIMDGEPAINALEAGIPVHDVHSWRIEEHYFDSSLTAVLPTSSASLGCYPRAPPPGSPLDGHLPFNPGHFRPSTFWHEGRWIRGLIAPAPSGHDLYYRTWDPAYDINDDGDDDDDDESTVDLVITGVAIDRSGDIPYHHNCSMPPGSTLYGTVRKWDGLITLNVDSSQPGNTTNWTWRGYLIGSGPNANFVGRFKQGHVDVNQYAYEGAITMARRQTLQ